MPDDELEGLLATYDEDRDVECARCGRLFCVMAGDFQTRYCDTCARDLAIGDDE